VRPAVCQCFRGNMLCRNRLRRCARLCAARKRHFPPARVHARRTATARSLFPPEATSILGSVWKRHDRAFFRSGTRQSPEDTPDFGSPATSATGFQTKPGYVATLAASVCPMKRRRLLIVACILFGLWVLTLGIFHERTVTSDFQVASGDAWAAFENGDETFYPNTWIDAGNYRTIGLPYLVHSVTDRPPYTLSVCFTANVEQQVKSITIDSINVDYDSGQHAAAVDKENAQTSTFDLDDRGAERGEKPYLRAGFSFSDCLSRRESFWATITGSYTKGDATIPYKTRVRVRIRNEAYLYPGWIAWGLRGL
jgi:hypothetical protein